MATTQTQLQLNLFGLKHSCKKSCFRQYKFVPRASSSSISRRRRRKLILDTAMAAAAAAVLTLSSSTLLELQPSKAVDEWERLHLPIVVDSDVIVLLHTAFIPYHPLYGIVLGNRRTILETKDGGSTWVPRSQLPDDKRYHGDRGKSSSKEERPRFFDLNAKSLCWEKAATVPGRHPDRWRKDAAGNIVGKRFHNCQGCLCYEYDHIIPFSKGGPSVEANCQILQTRVNRFKSDKDDINMTELEGYSCDVRFSDKELDIIEMAVYGDVLRPGNQCRVGTVDKIHGSYKSKDRMRACKLP